MSQRFAASGILKHSRIDLMDLITTKRLSANRKVDRAAWLAIREICCRTGDNGRAIARQRWDFFARVWIDPYEKLLPEWTYVAMRDESIVGYLTGCPDSRKFNRAKFWRADLPLLTRIAVGRYRHDSGARQFARRAIGFGKRAEQHFSPALHQTLIRSYPAHLHVNVDESYRRAGIGRRLIESYFTDLRRRGVTGVHLFCGGDPVKFYQRLNFQVLETAPSRNTTVFVLGQRL